MKIAGKVWKSRKDSLWLAEIPFLNVMTQAESKEEIPEMVQDAIELLADDGKFSVQVVLENSSLYVEANDIKKLIALILKRQRLKKGFKLEEVSSHLKAKSINDYAQYERGKHLPSMEKFEQLLRAIDPALMPIMTLRR